MQTLAGKQGSKDYYLAYIEEYDKVIVWVNDKQKYMIINQGSICDCPGARYHGHCKHVDFATQEFNFNKVVKPRGFLRLVAEEYYKQFLEKEKDNGRSV
jgi:hypothetical protein